MNRRRWVATLCFLIVSGGVACAHPARSEATMSNALPVRPPRLKPGLGPFTMRSPPSSGFTAHVEIPVDAEGRPDALRIRVTGTIPSHTLEDLIRWLQEAEFEPARQVGVPVDGVYKMELQARRR